MIQPKRYSLVASYYCSDAKMEAFEDGEFVRHADYAALQAENERLQKLCYDYSGHNQRIIKRAMEEEVELLKLRAENARLRKAGDAMENELFRVILMELPGLGKEDINNQYIAAWLAAKGVQP